MSDKAHKAQKLVVEEKIEEMLLWYIANSGGKEPTQMCEDKKSYRGKVVRWLEPPIPKMDNPVLIEECIGDSWTLRFEVMK